jgi:hypothetical protein
MDLVASSWTHDDRTSSSSSSHLQQNACSRDAVVH